MRKKHYLAVLLLAVILILALPAAAMASPDPGADPSADPSSPPSSSGGSSTLEAIATNIIDLWDIFLSSARALLTQTPGEWSPASWEITQNIHGQDGAGNYGTGIKPIAVNIMIILWAVSFFRHVDGLHKIDVREVLSWILRFMLIYAIIEISFALMNTILQISMAINTRIIAEVDEAEQTMQVSPELLQAYADFDEAMESANIFEKIGLFFQTLIPMIALVAVWVIVFCCGLIIVVTLALRFFKMYIYAAIAPIPLATFAGSETQDVGKHFLKNWFAVCLEVCIIAIAIGVFTASLSDSNAMFPLLEEKAGEIGTFFEGEAAEYELFKPTVLWGVNVAVKIVLLASVVRGADQISQKIVGAG